MRGNPRKKKENFRKVRLFSMIFKPAPVPTENQPTIILKYATQSRYTTQFQGL